MKPGAIPPACVFENRGRADLACSGNAVVAIWFLPYGINKHDAANID